MEREKAKFDKQDKIGISVCIAALIICIVYGFHDINTNPQYGLKGLKTGFEQAGYNIENIEFVRTEKLFVFRATEPITYEKDGGLYEYWKVDSFSYSMTGIIPPKYIVYPYDNNIKPADWK